MVRLSSSWPVYILFICLSSSLGLVSQVMAEDGVSAWLPFRGELVVRSGQESDIRSIDRGTLNINDNDVVLIPVKRGTRIQVRRGVSGPSSANDDQMRFGFAHGLSLRETTIAWDENTIQSRVGQFRVPSWSNADWIAVGSNRGGTLHLQIAKSVHDPMAMLRFKQDLRAWLGGNKDMPTPHTPGARWLLRLATEARDLLGSSQQSYLRDWVMNEVEDYIAETHSLRFPWFRPISFSIRRVRPVRRGVVHLRADETAEIVSDHASVIVLKLAARRGEATRIEIRNGPALVHNVEWTGQEQSGEYGWSRWKREVRVAVHPSLHVTLRVVTGKVRAEVDAFRRLRAIGEFAVERKDTGDAREKLAHATDPKTRAFFVSEVVRSARDLVEAQSAAEDALKNRTELAPAMEFRLATRLLDLRLSLASETRCRPAEKLPSDAYAIAAAGVLSALCEPTQLERPFGTAALELVANTFGDEEHWNEVAKTVDFTEGYWRTLDSTDQENVKHEHVSVRNLQGKSTCSTHSGDGVRWSMFPSGVHVIHAKAETVAPLRVMNPSSLWEGFISINEVQVPVHGASSLESRIRLPPGKLVVTVPEGAPTILFRVPRTDEVSCDQLRELRTWTLVEQRKEFPLPDVGIATAVRVEVRVKDGASATPRLVMHVGHAQYRIELPERFQIATFEVPVPARASSIVLENHGGRFWTRTRLRLKRGASKTEAVAAETPRVEPVDPGVALPVIADTSRALRIAVDGQADLLRKRANALESIGYDRLASWDRERAALFPLDAPDLVASPLAQSTSIRAAMAVNLPARIAPLSIGNEAALRRARSFVFDGDLQRAETALVGVENIGPAELLLLGHVADRLGHSAVAARAWAQLNTPDSLARAAQIHADIASRTRDSKESMAAFVLAASAAHGGEKRISQSVISRVYSAIRWTRAASSDASAGSRVIVQDASVVGTTRSPLSIALRKALIDAPSDSLLLLEDQSLEVTLRLKKETRVSLEGLCDSMPPTGVCHLEVSSSLSREKVALNPTWSSLFPVGIHRIVITPHVRGVAWVRVQSARETSELSLRTRTLWFETVPHRHLDFSAAGPTVARVEMRSREGEEAEIEFLLDGAPFTKQSVDAEIESLDVPIPDPGPHRLTMRTLRGTALARVAFARAGEFPSAPGTTGAPLEITSRGVLPGLPLNAPIPPKDYARTAPFSVEGYVRGVGKDVRDLDNAASGAPYGELGAGLYWAGGSLPVYTHISVFARERTGPTSLGADARIEIPAEGWRPRFIFEGTIAGQRLPVWRTGFVGRLATLWTVPVFKGLTLFPMIMGRYFYAPPIQRDMQNVDPDVYSQFRDDHPFGIWAGLIAYARPLSDFSARIRLSTLTDPDVHSFDRLEALFQMDALPGRGLVPWITFTYLTSYRFQTFARRRPFLRHGPGIRAFAWHWTEGAHRVGVFAEAAWYVDAHFVDWGFGISYLWSQHRGVYDLPPRDVEHRDRLQEGSELSETLRSAKWSVGTNLD